MAKKKIGVAVVGLKVGQHHLNGYETLPDCRVVALVDKNEEVLAERAEGRDVPHLLTDYRKALALKDIDVVSICTPNRFHAPMAVDALNAGKHVLVEKPMAATVQQAKRMVETARRKRRKLMVGYCLRQQPAHQYVQQLAQSGEFGDIYLGKARAIRRFGLPRSHFFWQKKLSGGGAVVDLAVHCFDLVWWIMGRPKPVTVNGITRANFLEYVPKDFKPDVEDHGLGFVRFDNGAVMVLEASWAMHMSRDLEPYAQVYGSKGGASLQPHGVYQHINGAPAEIKPGCPEISWTDSIAAEVAHFVECVRKGRTPMCPGEDGLIAVRVLNALYRSAEAGKEIRLK